MSKEVETVVFNSCVDIDDPEFIPPSNWFFVSATGSVIFILCRNRRKAQDWVDTNYGKGKYTVRSIKLG